MSECKSRAQVAVMFALLAGAASVASAAADPPRLDLVWVDPTDIATGTFKTVAAESRAVLAATGAEVTWTAAHSGAVVGPESIVVIAVPTYPTSLNRGRHVMGSTRMVADGALAVWVFPDQVAWALGLDLEMRRSWGQRAEKSFGVALARVASHEIVHALGAASHSHRGLMTARLDRNALTSPTLRIDGATVAAIRLSFGRGARMADRSWTPSFLRVGPFTAAAELVAAPGSNH
jgi:hypothetical protein